MSNVALDIIGMVIGCALSVAIIIVALTWRELKLKKSTVKQEDKGWSIMSAYRDSNKSKREQYRNDKTS